MDEADPNANWSWSTGEAWTYTNWFADEPNDFNGVASEQCLEMYSNGQWNDIGPNSDGYNLGFIVETVPEPCSLAIGSGLLLSFLRKKRNAG